MKYLLYSSVGCHLCEEALALCLQVIASSKITVIDILDDDDKEPEEPGSLYSQYGISIPVLKNQQSQQELFWPFDLHALQEFIQ